MDSIITNTSDVLILRAKGLIKEDNIDSFRKHVIQQIEEGVVIVPCNFDCMILKRDYITQEGK